MDEMRAFRGLLRTLPKNKENVKFKTKYLV